MSPYSQTDPEELLQFDKLNISISAYRVMFIFLLLTQYRSLSIQELNLHLFENRLIGRTFNSETITKYINTLRSLGCNIPKATSKTNFQYELQQNPFAIDFTDAELQAARAVLNVLSQQTEEEHYHKYDAILRKIAWMIHCPDKRQMLLGKSALKMKSTTQATDLGFAQQRHLLKQYQKFCKDSLVLEIQYGQGSKPPRTLQIEPYRVVEDGRQLFLIAMDRNGEKHLRVNLEWIREVRQLPSKVQGRFKQQTVIFQLHGKLSKSYRPYPNEEVLPLLIGQENVLTVKTKTDDTVGLLKRLLKYGELCEVVSPTVVRLEMQHLIRTMLYPVQQHHLQQMLNNTP